MAQNETDNFRPTDLITSKMRFYSVGVVAENKVLGNDTIEVTPVEELTMLDGELSAKGTEYKATATDALGKTYESAVKAQVTIKASWLRFGSANRLTSPDVRRGEGVMIFQFGDADKYYWITLKQDSNLRKLETVVWAISATKEEGAKTDADHSYYFEVSSHKKLVHFHTSKADGEPFMYDVQINTKDGYISITDDAGNYISIDSANARMEMHNTDGSHIDMDRTNLTITTIDTITHNTKSFTVNSETAVINAPTTTINASTATVNASVINVVGGDVTISGASVAVI